MSQTVVGPAPTPAVLGYYNLHLTSTQFDDLTAIKAHQPTCGPFRKIKSITGYFNEKNVVGLQTTYQLANGQVITCNNNGRQDNFFKSMIGSISGKKITKQKLDIPDGDYVQMIRSVYNEKKVVCLAFTTYRGLSVVFGPVKAEPVTFYNPGLTFGPPRGGYDSQRLNYIMFPTAAIPPPVQLAVVPTPMVKDSRVLVRQPNQPPKPIPMIPKPSSAQQFGLASSSVLLQNKATPPLPPKPQIPNKVMEAEGYLRQLSYEQQIQRQAQAQRVQILQLRRMQVQNNLQQQIAAAAAERSEQSMQDSIDISSQSRRIQLLQNQSMQLDKSIAQASKFLEIQQERHKRLFEQAKMRLDNAIRQMEAIKKQQQMAGQQPKLTTSQVGRNQQQENGMRTSQSQGRKVTPNTLTVPGQQPSPNQPPPPQPSLQQQPPPQQLPPQLTQQFSQQQLPPQQLQLAPQLPLQQQPQFPPQQPPPLPPTPQSRMLHSQNPPARQPPQNSNPMYQSQSTRPQSQSVQQPGVKSQQMIPPPPSFPTQQQLMQNGGYYPQHSSQSFIFNDDNLVPSVNR